MEFNNMQKEPIESYKTQSHNVSDEPEADFSDSSSKVGETKNASVRLSGAARKRLRLMMAKGMSFEKAKAIEVKKHMSYKAVIGKNCEDVGPSQQKNKRSRTERSTPDNDHAKRGSASTRNESSFKASEKTSTYTRNQDAVKEVVPQTKVAILHKDHPEAKLEDDNVAEIRKALVTEIKKIPEGGPIIQLSTIVRREGWISITCHNKETLEWIMHVGMEIKP